MKYFLIIFLFFLTFVNCQYHRTYPSYDGTWSTSTWANVNPMFKPYSSSGSSGDFMYNYDNYNNNRKFYPIQTNYQQPNPYLKSYYPYVNQQQPSITYSSKVDHDTTGYLLPSSSYSTQYYTGKSLSPSPYYNPTSNIDTNRFSVNIPDTISNIQSAIQREDFFKKTVQPLYQ